jgi:hypothetical protein
MIDVHRGSWVISISIFNISNIATVYVPFLATLAESTVSNSIIDGGTLVNEVIVNASFQVVVLGEDHSKSVHGCA